MAPLDPRLPPPAARELLVAALRPTHSSGPDGDDREHRRRAFPPSAGTPWSSRRAGRAPHRRRWSSPKRPCVASAEATSQRLGVDPRARQVARLHPPQPRRWARSRDPGDPHGHRPCRPPPFDAGAVDARSRVRSEPRVARCRRLARGSTPLRSRRSSSAVLRHRR